MFLQDILQSMERIAEYIEGLSFNDFISDHKTVDAVIRNFEIIGEAARKIPHEIKSKYPEIPWEEMYLLRNKVSHEYFGVDFDIIWEVASHQLPKNKIQIKAVIEKESTAQ